MSGIVRNRDIKNTSTSKNLNESQMISMIMMKKTSNKNGHQKSKKNQKK